MHRKWLANNRKCPPTPPPAENSHIHTYYRRNEYISAVNSCVIATNAFLSSWTKSRNTSATEGGNYIYFYSITHGSATMYIDR